MTNDNRNPTTTDAGIPVASDEHSLTVGPDGPILLQDHYLIEQMANFNRERTPERAASLGVRLSFWDPLPVEVRHLLDEVMILQQDRAVGPDGERVLIAGDRNTGIVCRGLAAVVRHDRASVVFARKS
jgi:hypothetical protein